MESHGSAWRHVLQAAAALAAGMGVGRFVYTPILPLMLAQAGLSAPAAASLATANYAGYFAGALAGTLLPALARSSAVLRGSLVLVIATLGAMPLTHGVAAWWAVRLVSGAASALVFVSAVSSILSNTRGRPAHLAGWGFGGIGAGIALSGTLMLITRAAGDWRFSWWASAVLAALLAAASWTLRLEPSPASAPAGGAGRSSGRPRTHRWFGALWASYTLEGAGYIIAGTFLVAAIEQTSPGWLGSGAWVLAGLAAVPSAALWAWLSRRWSRPGMLLAALVVQAAGITLPAVFGGVTAALISAALFGATFVGVATMAMAAGAHLQFPRSVALLTAGYSAGQILGPVAVMPSLPGGYHPALLVAAIVVLAAAAMAGALRIRFPHHLPAADLLAQQAGPEPGQLPGAGDGPRRDPR